MFINFPFNILPVGRGGTGGTSAQAALNGLGAVGVLATVAAIDLKVTGQTTLFTVPAGKTLIITDVIVRATSADTVAVAPIVRVGKTASFNEWAPLATLTNLTAAGSFYSLAPFAIALIRQTFAAAEVVKIDVQTGATAVALVATVHVIGYLV